jgi:hypothetical protein
VEIDKALMEIKQDQLAECLAITPAIGLPALPHMAVKVYSDSRPLTRKTLHPA